MVLTFTFAGLNGLESVEFAKLLSNSNTARWAGKPGAVKPGVGCLWHRPLGFSQASSLPSSPRVPNDRRPAARAPGFCAGGITYGRGANRVTYGPGMSGRHQWPKGGQGSPVAQGPRAAVREAWRPPHAHRPPPVQSRGCERLGSERSLVSRAGPTALHNTPGGVTVYWSRWAR